MRDVVVKAKAKMGKIPDDNLYLQLASLGDFDKKVDILSKAYPDVDYSREKVNFEANNFKKMFAEIKSIDYFLTGLESDFFNLYFSKYEILFLQEIIESLVNNNFSRNYLTFKSNPLSDNFVLVNKMNLESFIKANQNSRYYRTLLPFLNKNMQAENLIFLTSNALMKFYYRSLLKLCKKFPSKEHKLVRNFLGEEINLLNFEMLYRLKTYYDLNDNDIFNYLIEGGNSFNGQRLKDLSLLSREITKENSDILYVISAMNIIFISRENIEALMELDDSFNKDERLEYLIVR